MKRFGSEVTVTIAPARWRLRCPQKSTCRPAPEGARRADRHWWREYVALIENGYIPHDAGGFYLRADYDDARRTVCDCGEDMDFRGFELIGPQGERVAYRRYALCPMCRAWAEF